jgi:hypothetical protein
VVRGVVAESVIEYGPELRRVSVWVWRVRVKRNLVSGENEFRTATVTLVSAIKIHTQLMSSAFGAATTTLTRSSAHCRVLFATRPLIDILKHIPHIMNELLS